MASLGEAFNFKPEEVILTSSYTVPDGEYVFAESLPLDGGCLVNGDLYDSVYFQSNSASGTGTVLLVPGLYSIGAVGKVQLSASVAGIIFYMGGAEIFRSTAEVLSFHFEGYLNAITSSATSGVKTATMSASITNFNGFKGWFPSGSVFSITAFGTGNWRISKYKES